MERQAMNIFQILNKSNPEFSSEWAIIESWNTNTIPIKEIRNRPGVTDDNVMEIIFALSTMVEKGFAIRAWNVIDKNGAIDPICYYKIENIPENSWDFTTTFKLSC